MEDTSKKSKRKSTHNSEPDRLLKVAKHTSHVSEELGKVRHQGEEALLKDSVVSIGDSCHTQLLDSIEGHIKVLGDVNDSPDTGEPLSKSAARRLKKKQNLLESGRSFSNELHVKEMSSCVASKETALEYLKMWSEERERWSFKKKTQFWLLQNMYHKSKVPKASFKVLLDYLEGLQGHQRQLVVDKAKSILELYSEDSQTESSPTKREYKRAVAILRVLA